MQNTSIFQQSEPLWKVRQWQTDNPAWRRGAIGLLLIVALFAFEIFNYDTTRFALGNLLGEISFAGIRWAAILAIAFCAIDFAGLAYLFSPDRNEDGAQEVWYLMGAWLLGATMNALMTWWAVSVTLLSHEFGNEVLSRQQLLEIVPPFVAVLVWLTRILFIGAFSAAGSHLFADDSNLPAENRSLRGPDVIAAELPRRAIRSEAAATRSSMPPPVRPVALQMSARAHRRS